MSATITVLLDLDYSDLGFDGSMSHGCSLSRLDIFSAEAASHGFKLVNSAGERSKEGWGLLLYDGGTVCDSPFDNTAASAICLAMG